MAGALITLSSLFTANVTAQAIIHGRVVDKTGKPAPGANALLLHSPDSVLEKGTVTDERGDYSFAHIKAGNYWVVVSAVGFKQVYSSSLALSGSENVDLGIQTLNASDKQLAQVTVTAKKPLFEQKIDRLIVNVQSNITAAGSTVLDILERSPGVIVDRQNNTISLAGKSGVVLMINGKINHMPIDAVIQMLGGMSGGNIDKIELITTPPANFDAEGNAGYINIVLKQNSQSGTNGTYSLSMGYGNRDMPQANINLNHREGKINLYGDYSFSRLHAEQDWYFFHQASNEGVTTATRTYTYRNTVQRNHNVRIGMDYQIDKKTVIGVLAMGYNNKWSMNANNESYISVHQPVDTFLTIANSEKNQWTNYGGNINLQHNFSDKEKFSFNADYIHYHDDNPNEYAYNYYDGGKNFLSNQQTRSTKNTPISFWVNAADFSLKMTPKIDLETGLKSTISRFNNGVGVDRLTQNGWVGDPAFSAKYVLNEDIEAAYASLNINIGSRTDLKVGLRYEHTNSNLGSDSIRNIVDRHYGNLFPSLFITRRINDNNTLSFAYSRRITRPTFNDMAPFVIFIDPTTFFSGNPALQPSLSDAFKVDYSFKKYLLSVSYTYEGSPIADFNPSIDSVTNVETLGAVNLPNDKVVAVTLAFPYEFRPWWSLSFSATGIWNQINAVYNGSPLQITQENLNISASQTFKLHNDFSLELTGFYHSPALFGVYRQISYGSLDIGAQKKLGGNKGNLRLVYSDIFNTMRFNLSVNRPDLNLVLYDHLAFTFPAVRLTYTRSFGNSILKSARNRSTGSEDEEGRVHN
jgi:hypothetical protein